MVGLKRTSLNKDLAVPVYPGRQKQLSNMLKYIPNKLYKNNDLLHATTPHGPLYCSVCTYIKDYYYYTADRGQLCVGTLCVSIGLSAYVGPAQRNISHPLGLIVSASTYAHLISFFINLTIIYSLRIKKVRHSACMQKTLLVEIKKHTKKQIRTGWTYVSLYVLAWSCRRS